MNDKVQEILDNKGELSKLIIGRSFRQSAVVLGVGTDTIIKYSKKHGIADLSVKSPDVLYRDLTREIKWADPIIPSEEKDLIVTSDFHIPFMSKFWFNVMMETAKKEKIKSLVIAGDLIDAEHFGIFVRPGESEPWQKTNLPAIREAFSRMLEWFKNIYITTGNHTKRIFRQMLYTINSNNLLQIFVPHESDRIHWTDCDYFTWESENGLWRICHPSGPYATSVMIKAPTLATDLADKYDCHVAQGHRHFVGMAISKYRRKLGIDTGGLFDAEQLLYINRTNRAPIWDNGFLILKKGRPTIIHSNITDMNPMMEKFRLMPGWEEDMIE